MVKIPAGVNLGAKIKLNVMGILGTINLASSIHILRLKVSLSYISASF